MATNKRGRPRKGQNTPGSSEDWSRTNQDCVFFLQQYEKCVDQDALKEHKVVFREDLKNDPGVIHPEKTPRVNINIYKTLPEGFGRVKDPNTPGVWEETNLRRNFAALTKSYISWKKTGKGEYE